MPAPTDPAKYEEWKKNCGRANIGKVHSEITKQSRNKSIKEALAKPETKNHMRLSHTGERNGFFGKHHSSKSLMVIKEKATNRIVSDETRSKQSDIHKRENLSDTTITKLSDHAKQLWADPIERDKMVAGRAGRKLPPRTEIYIDKQRKSQSGKMASDITKERMSKSHVGKTNGSKHYNWKGGLSFKDYCFKFNRRRKRATSHFFWDCCICCGKHKDENIKITRRVPSIILRPVELSTHHVDHNRDQGCGGIPFNLVPMCLECHSKEQHHEEEYRAYINRTLAEGFKWGIWSEQEYIEQVMYPE